MRKGESGKFKWICFSPLFSLFIFLPLFSGKVYPGWLLIDFFLALAFFSLWVGKILKEGKVSLPSPYPFLFLLFFAGMSSLSSFFSIYSYPSYEYLLLLFAGMGIYFALGGIFSLPRERKFFLFLLGGILGACLFVSFQAIEQYLGGFEYTKRWILSNLPRALQEYPPELLRGMLGTQRASGSFFSPGGLGTYLSMVLPLPLVFYFKERKILRSFIYLLLILIFYFALLSSHSRAAYAVILILALFFLFVKGKKNIFSSKFLILLGGGMVTTFLFLKLSPPSLDYLEELGIPPPSSRIEREILGRITFSSSEENLLLRTLKSPLFTFKDSLRRRMLIFRSTWRVARDFWAKGSGPGTLEFIYGKYKVLGAEETKYAHNDYLQILAETGIFGFLFFLGFLFSLLKDALRVKKGYLEWAIFAGLLAFLLNSLFDFNFYTPSLFFLFWLWCGMVGSFSPQRKIKGGRVFFSLLVPLLIFIGMEKIRFYRADLYLRKGREAIKRGDFFWARKWFEEGERINPLSSSLPEVLGYLYADIYRISSKPLFLDKSLQSLRRAIHLSPTVPHLYHKLGLILKEKKDFKGAEKAFLEAFSLYPHKFLYQKELAEFYLKGGETKKAFPWLVKIVEEQPRFWLLKLWREETLFLPAVKEALKRNLAKTPTPPVLLRRGIYFILLGKVKEGKTLLSSLKKNVLVGERVFSFLGWWEKERGEEGKAEKTWLEGIRKFPAWREGYLRLASLWEERKDYERAEWAYKKSLLLDPLDPFPYQRLKEIYQTLGRKKEEKLMERISLSFP